MRSSKAKPFFQPRNGWEANLSNSKSVLPFQTSGRLPQMLRVPVRVAHQPSHDRFFGPGGSRGFVFEESDRA
jgi:hypothetical protein